MAMPRTDFVRRDRRWRRAREAAGEGLKKLLVEGSKISWQTAAAAV
jgi:hypothetical protein